MYISGRLQECAPSRRGPIAAITRASGGCCASYPYVFLSSHSIPQAMCAGSSTVWLKTVYVVTIRTLAIVTSKRKRAAEYREMNASPRLGHWLSTATAFGAYPRRPLLRHYVANGLSSEGLWG